MKIWTKEEESKRLKARIDHLDIPQKEFAMKFKIPGGSSMISQHVSGNRPIGLRAAIAYANAFNCTLVEISPRLAEEQKRAQSVMAESSNVETGSSTSSPAEGYVSFDLLDIEAGAGDGRNAMELPEIVQQVNVLEFMTCPG